MGLVRQRNGQFNVPVGVATDAAFNVYVAEFNNNRVQKFVAPPSIALVSDVGNDEGREARLRILRSSADSPGSGASIVRYDIFRRIDPLPAPAAGAVPAPVASPQLAGWEQVGSISAYGESEYNAVVPTLTDATASALNYTAFFVRAATASPYQFYDAGIEYGYSVDNLPPPTPSPFTAAYAAGATQLHWGVSSAGDFSTFKLYRGASADFLPGAGNLLVATADTGFADPGAPGNYYKLSSVDRNGNESGFALVGPGQTSDVDGSALPRALELAPPGPNPARGASSIRFAVPRQGLVRLRAFDVNGRLVDVLASKQLPPGEYTVTWDLQDAGGDAALDDGEFLDVSHPGGAA